MIRKRSTRPADLDLANEVMRDPDYEALPERVRSGFRKYVSGLKGEKETAFMLDRKFGLDSDANLLIHNLRIPDGQGGFAQFDHILLSRLSRTASIFESKNFAGKISKNKHGEWTVWYDNQRLPTDIANPVEQVRRQRDVLAAWFKRHNHAKAFEQIGIFVSVPPTARIDRKKIEESERIFKADNLFNAWVEFGGISKLGRLLSTGVGTAQMIAIADQLIAEHVEETNIYVRLGIHPGTDDGEMDQDTLSPDEPGLERAVDAAAVLTAVQEEPVPAGTESIAPIINPMILEETPNQPGSRKASAQVEVCAGIMERTLPDGRVAFRAAKDDAIGREALTALCKGKAVWNPMFANWVCSPEIATEIRGNLPNAVQMAQLP